MTKHEIIFLNGKYLLPFWIICLKWIKLPELSGNRITFCGDKALYWHESVSCVIYIFLYLFHNLSLFHPSLE